jgi:ankyrin repeat protein
MQDTNRNDENVREVLDILDDDNISDKQKLTRISEIGIDCTNSDGDTALMLESLMGNLGAVQFLLRHGADPDIENSQGDTALSYAIDNGEVRIVYELAWSADVNHENVNGDTPLALAMYGGYSSAEETLKYHGAIDTGKPCYQQRLVDEMYQSIPYMNGSLEKVAISQYPLIGKLDAMCACDKLYCTTCGGKLHAVKKSLDEDLKKEIIEFLKGLPVQGKAALGNWKKLFSDLGFE